MTTATKTKKAQAITLFNKGCDKQKTRGEILVQIQTKLNMTPAAAKNYYQKIASGTWA